MNTKNKKGAGWYIKSLFILVLVGTVVGTVFVGIGFWHFSNGLPRMIELSDYRPLAVTRVLGAGGKENELMGEFYKERRYLIPYDKMPELVVKAFIAAEDDRFFEHQGVNLASILRAAIVNFKAGHYVQGGSTITQQVVKSLLLTPERSFIRKIKEVILASRIEKNLTKQQILYLYLNQIYLGHGAYGVQAATQTYFRKDVSAITLGEAAMLAGMPQAPGKYSPHQNPKHAKDRQLYVLRRMYENKFITQAQMSEAAAEPLRVYHDENINTKIAPYYVEHVRRYLIEKYGEKAVYEDGLTVSVPITKDLSVSASKNLREGLRAVDKRMGYRGPLQHFKTATDIEKALQDQRIALIQKKAGYSLLLPDGRLDPIEAMRAGGLHAEVQLLDIGENYPAIVTSLDDRRKVTGVMIGAIKAELPLEKMKWARPLREEKSPVGPRGEPTAPSKAFLRGDQILVRVDKVEGNHVSVSLEQDPIIQGAIVSIDAQSGNLLAMEGGYDFERSEFNRAVQAMRQSGSAFKPILYSAALEKGYTPATMIVDSPIVYGDGESGKWKPSNFEEKFYGDTTFRQSLIHSRNVPTIKIAQAIQVPFIIAYTKRIGLNAQLPSDLSISLGSASLSLLELTKAYALFPRLGRVVHPVFISNIKDRDGKILEQATEVPTQKIQAAPSLVPISNAPSPGLLPAYPTADNPDQVMDPRAAFVMTHLMKEVVNFGTGHGAKDLGRTSAGKTGTTSDYIDAWYMGFTPQVVTGVWVGFDSQKTVGSGETGARASLPIWLNFMKDAVKGYPDTDFNVPPGIVFVSIDPVSGKRVAPNASNSIKEAFIEGTEPPETTGSDEASSGSQSDFLKEDID